MTTCVFRYCKNSSRNVTESSYISFHRFVHPGHPLRQEWIKIVQEDRSERTWLPSKYSFVCSMHFKDDDFYTTQMGKRFLTKSAIPCSHVSQYLVQSQDTMPTSLVEVQMSETEPILDSPRVVLLKQNLGKFAAANKTMRKQIMTLQRENKNLKQKVNSLTAIVKQFKDQYGIDIKSVEKLKSY